MFSRATRAAAVVALAASMLWGLTAAHAGTPRPASRPSVDAGALAPTAVVYSQPPSSSGGLLHSSLRDPDGSATDGWVWDGFVLGSAQSITEVRWRGGYDPAYGPGGPVNDFTVDIYRSIAAGTEPDVVNGRLAHHHVGGNAGETPADVLGGLQTYAYHFVLPYPFPAEAGNKYWVQIEALQSSAPNWGLAKGTGGDSVHFRTDGYIYQTVPGDAAFELLAPGNPGFSLYLPLLSSLGSG